MGRQLITDIRETAYQHLDSDPEWVRLAVLAERVEAGVQDETEGWLSACALLDRLQAREAIMQGNPQA